MSTVSALEAPVRCLQKLLPCKAGGHRLRAVLGELDLGTYLPGLLRIGVAVVEGRLPAGRGRGLILLAAARAPGSGEGAPSPRPLGVHALAGLLEVVYALVAPLSEAARGGSLSCALGEGGWPEVPEGGPAVLVRWPPGGQSDLATSVGLVGD